MPQHSVENTSQYTETEQKIIAIWTDVLQIEAPPVNVHFVDLGGDSLAAMSCISRFRSTFGVEFGIEEFFWDHATIAELAATIDQSQKIQSQA